MQNLLKSDRKLDYLREKKVFEWLNVLVELKLGNELSSVDGYGGTVVMLLGNMVSFVDEFEDIVE